MKQVILGAVAFCLAATSAKASYRVYFPASCSESEIEHMGINSGTESRTQFECRAVVLSHLDNGQYLVTFLPSKPGGLVLSYVGKEVVQSTDSPLLEMPVMAIFLPDARGDPMNMKVNSDSTCVFSTSTSDILSLIDVACIASPSNVGQPTSFSLYSLKAHVIGAGKRMQLKQETAP
jgi:hypothetical protein